MLDGHDSVPPSRIRPEPYEARVRAELGERYQIVRLIAEGGMATVFLALDRKHSRHVAVKVLHETLAHTIGIQRFLREIEVIARLQHPHLLTLIDSGNVDGLPFYVMPYVERLSLRETIAERKQLPFDEAVTIMSEVADGLAYAHQHGVIHRDIKPSNILMSGGHAVIADFGIATALQAASAGRLTETGISLGSPTYMSPEQASGERDVDSRSDVYSLACVLYEMLAGEPPIDSASMQQIVTKKLTGSITKLHERRPDVSPLLEAAINKGLAPDRAARFASMEEFKSAIIAALPVAQPRNRRAIWIGAAAVVLASAGAGGWLRHERRVVRATQQVAEVQRLSIDNAWVAAFRLAEAIRPIIPNDSILNRIRPGFTDFLKIVTAPAGAHVSMQAVDQPDTAWRMLGTSPLDSIPIPKWATGGAYKLRIEHEGYDRAEVSADLFTDWRSAAGRQAIDTLRLDRVNEAPPGMVRIPGWRIRDPLHPGDSVTLADYHIGKYEVTNREYARFVAAGGYTNRSYWTEPMVRNGRPVTWEQAMSEFRDRTGRPGPSAWSGGTFPVGQQDFPVGGVSYYEASAYARFAGKRLPTSAHWEQAALRNFRESGWLYMRSSNVNGTQPRAVGQGIFNAFGLYDVAGNVREWCVNPIDSGRLTRGAGWEDGEFRTGHLIPKPEFDRSQSNGFRLVALSDDDTTVAHLTRRLTRGTPRDFRNVVAASDADFANYRRMFDYDRGLLDWRRDTSGVAESFRWEKVSFSAAYGGERMIAYLFLPRDVRPPYESVIFWPPGAPTALNATDPGLANFLAFIPRSGRAAVLPVFKGSYERDGDAFKGARFAPDTTIEYRDLAIDWVKDVRRTIDYLQTRPDMIPDRVGYYGVSWGGEIAPFVLAIETRIKAAVLNSGGYRNAFRRAEIEAPSYAPRVHTPTLLLNGQHDNVLFPYETSQVPFFQQLGTRDKRRVLVPASHVIVSDTIVHETLAWYDRYLSGKR